MWCVVKALHYITFPCVPELMCLKWLQVWQKDSQLQSLVLGLPKRNAVGWLVALARYIRNKIPNLSCCHLGVVLISVFMTAYILADTLVS